MTGFLPFRLRFGKACRRQESPLLVLYQRLRNWPPAIIRGRSMDFVSAIKSGFKNTFKYQGRASRSEFWWFYLFNILSFAGFMIIDTILAAIFPHSGDQNNVNIAQLIIYGILALVGLVYFIASCLASLSLTVRRLHDSDKSGWFLLLGLVPFGGIVLLVFYCLDGTRGPNQFGDDPLRPVASAASVF